MHINLEVAQKVLSVVDAGLVSGVGKPIPGQMCVEAAVRYALGLPHGDDPACVSRALRRLKIRLNDARWSSDQARAKGLRRLAVAQLGSAGELDDEEFVRHIVDLAIRKSAPLALRAAAAVHKDRKHRAALLDAAAKCEKEGARQAAIKAKKVAAAAADAAASAADAFAAAYAAASAADAAADDAAYAAASGADAASAAYAAAYAASAAGAAADAAAAAAADAAAARDKSLSDYAEDVVQILIEMKAPGCQWLALTEVTP